MKNTQLWNRSFLFACGANFSMFFAFYMLLPVMSIYLGQELGADNSQIGMILSSYVIMALLIRPFAGFFVDTLPRKALLVTCLGLYVLCFSGYIIAGSLLVFLLFRAFHGATFGITTVSMNTLAIDIMPAERRGEGIGYFGVMSNLAMAVGPMIALFVFDTTHNFHHLFMIAMGMALLGFILSLFIQSDPRPKPTGEVEPISLDRFILVKGLRAAAAMVFISFSYGMMTTYIAMYGNTVVGVTSGSGIFFMYFAAGLIVSRLVSGRLINKGLFKPVTITGIVLLIITYCFFVTMLTPIVYYVCGIALGVGYGVLSPSFQTMLINLAPHNKRGTANATYFASWDLGIGLGVLMGGIIADHWMLLTAFKSGIVMLIIGLVVYTFVVAPYYAKNKLR